MVKKSNREYNSKEKKPRIRKDSPNPSFDTQPKKESKPRGEKVQSADKQMNSILLIESKTLLKSLQFRWARLKMTAAPGYCKDINVIIEKLNKIKI